MDGIWQKNLLIKIKINLNMKKILLAIFIFISIQSFGQLNLYAEKKNTDNSITQYFVKLVLDSVFNVNGNYVCPTIESFEGHYQPVYPQGFKDFVKCIDGIYRNWIPFSENTMKIRWDSILGKPTISTVGGNLLAINNPASASLVRINSDGTVATRTAAQAKQDLNLDQVDNTTDANKPVSIAQQTALNNKSTFYVGTDAGANDSYTITASPVPGSYTNGMIVIFRANTTNTTGCSINVNGLGVRNIVKRVNTTTATGDILALMWCTLVYDGTNFVIMNPVVN